MCVDGYRWNRTLNGDVDRIMCMIGQWRVVDRHYSRVPDVWGLITFNEQNVIPISLYE